MQYSFYDWIFYWKECYVGSSSSVLNVTALFLVAASPGRKKKFWFSCGGQLPVNLVYSLTSSDGSLDELIGGGVSLKSSEMLVRVRCSPAVLAEHSLLMISWKLRLSMFRRRRWRRSHLPGQALNIQTWWSTLPKCLLQFFKASSFLRRILPWICLNQYRPIHIEKMLPNMTSWNDSRWIRFPCFIWTFKWYSRCRLRRPGLTQCNTLYTHGQKIFE